MKKLIVLIGGEARSGKNEFANGLNFYDKSMWCVWSFAYAEELKNITCHLFDLSDEQREGSLKEVEDPRYFNVWDGEGFYSPRRLFQLVGTELFRKLYPNIWVDYVGRQVERIITNDVASRRVFHGRDLLLIKITDYRFPNELSRMQSWISGTDAKLVTVKIERPDHEKIKHNNHTSEAIDKLHFDYVISNDGTLGDLYKKADDFLKTISEGIE